jgi:type IV/VI secretion system ImpK/VasF family protein
MVELAEKIFCFVLRLQNETEAIKKELLEKIKEFCAEAANKGYASGEIENAKYALCAWIDEYIYTNSSISSQWFSNSLVLSEFGEATAGEHFFEKMENFHKSKNSAPLLELYAKCILFGFMGKFRMGNSTELNQILNNAIHKTDMFLKPLNYKPATKSWHRFSFRRGMKNILITGICETQCKEFAKNQVPPKGYKYIYSDMKNIKELPFLDGVISIEPLAEKSYAEFDFKAPVYKVADLEIPEIDQTLDRNYEFNSEHLNYYLHKYFLDSTATKNILSLPVKFELFKKSEAFYSFPFFPFMKNESPLAYSLAKRMLFISFLAAALLSMIFFVFSVINKHREEIKKEAIIILQKNKNDSLKHLEDSLNAEFERDIKNLEIHYKKQILEKFPFKDGKIPSASEVEKYFSEDGDFCKFIDIIDTISDTRIKFNKKALAKLLLLKNNVWSEIPVSIIIKAPNTASVIFEVDSEYVEIERGQGKSMEFAFPKTNGKGIRVSAKSANSVFSENINGEWSLLKLPQRFSFKDKSYLIDIELFIDWHLPKNAIKPKDWFEIRLEPNLIENFSLTRNIGE